MYVQWTTVVTILMTYATYSPMTLRTQFCYFNVLTSQVYCKRLYNFHFLFRLTRSDPMVEIRVPYFVYDSFLKAFFEVNVSILLEIVLGKAAVGKKTWRPCFSTNIN